jgi:curved DNA-binding protein CbpA
MTDVQPTARGTLESQPLAHLLVYLVEKQLTGTLIVEEPSGSRSAILLQGGIPSKAKTAEPLTRIGELLVELGSLSEADRGPLQAAPGQPFGELLVQRGLVDRELLDQALKEQLRRRVLWLFTRPPESVYGYYDAKDFLSRWGAEPTPIDPLPVIASGIRDSVDPRHRDATLARLGDGVLRLHLDSKVGRFQLTPTERAVADIVRLKPQPLTALIGSELIEESTVRRVIYLLAITRHLDVGGAPIGVVGSGQYFSVRPGPNQASRPPGPVVASTVEPLRSSATPTSASRDTRTPSREAVEVARARAEILDRAERIGQQNLYEVLGVTPAASASEIQSTFLKLARQWHPDKLAPELAALRDVVTRTFARMNEAAQVLGDDKRRGAYDASLKATADGADEQQQVQRVLQAATAFQKAQLMLRTNNLAGAEAEVRRAMDDDPSQGEYKAFYAWIVAQKPGAESEQIVELMPMLDRAAQAEPNNHRILFYRALLQKRLGRDDLAIRDFRAVLERDPHNVDAAREIRLHQMRKGGAKSVPPPAGGGPGSSKNPLSKLFKR